MKKVPVTLVKSSDGDYVASSSESFGFFAVGESREEVLQNAREGLAILLNLEDDEFEIEITEVG